MKRKELTNKFKMISNCKIPFGLYGLYKNISALKGLKLENIYEIKVIATILLKVTFNMSGHIYSH